MELALIAAVAKNGVIGKNGELPWGKIPEDMKRFKALTLNHSVIMGRTTYKSIPSEFRPLPGRTNIVLSRDKNFVEDGIVIRHSIDEALKAAEVYGKVAYVIGGQSVYEQTIGLASRLELTEIHRDYEGDSSFPKFDKAEWREAGRMDREGYSFVTYKRKT